LHFELIENEKTQHMWYQDEKKVKKKRKKKDEEKTKTIKHATFVFIGDFTIHLSVHTEKQ
jgi:hypothetical protein